MTIYVFPGARMFGDIDNRIKPILGAMTQCVYHDDEQIERIVIQKFEADGVFAFHNPSTSLLEALGANEPTVYIRVSDDLYGDLH